MKYYDKLGGLKAITEDRLRYFDHGQTANVYMLDESIVFKRYFSYVRDAVIIDDEVFKLLQSFNDPQIVKLLELFKSEGNKNSAYTMEYVKEEDVDYLDEYSSVFLEHISELERIVDIFTEERLRVMDLKNSNVIVKKNGLVIIDPDKYRIVDYKPVISNKDQVLYLAYSLLNFGKSKVGDSLDRVKLLDFRHSIVVDESLDITSQLARTLKKTKKPIDIFRRAL